MNLLGFFPCVTEICFSPHLQFKGWAIVVLFTFQFPQEQRAEAGRWRRSLPELYRLALLHDLGSGLSSEILLSGEDKEQLLGGLDDCMEYTLTLIVLRFPKHHPEHLLSSPV